jgi:hypothetical protein
MDEFGVAGDDDVYQLVSDNEFQVKTLVEVLDNERVYPAVVTSIVDADTVTVKYFEFEGDQQTHVHKLRRMEAGPYNSKQCGHSLSLGAPVLSKFAEDGQYYKAVVTEFTEYGCMVYFTEYDNSQEVPLSYLLPRPKTAQTSSTSSAVDEREALLTRTLTEVAVNESATETKLSEIACSQPEQTRRKKNKKNKKNKQKKQDNNVDRNEQENLGGQDDYNDDFLSSPEWAVPPENAKEQAEDDGIAATVMRLLSGSPRAPKKKAVSFYAGHPQNDELHAAKPDEGNDNHGDSMPSPILGGSSRVTSMDLSDGEITKWSAEDEAGEHVSQHFSTDMVREEQKSDASASQNQNSAPNTARSNKSDKSNKESGGITRRITFDAVNEDADEPDDGDAREPIPIEKKGSAFRILKRTFTFKRKKSKFRKWTREEMILLLISLGIQIRSEEAVPTIMLQDECDKRFRHHRNMPVKPVPLQGEELERLTNAVLVLQNRFFYKKNLEMLRECRGDMDDLEMARMQNTYGDEEDDLDIEDEVIEIGDIDAVIDEMLMEEFDDAQVPSGGTGNMHEDDNVVSIGDGSLDYMETFDPTDPSSFQPAEAVLPSSARKLTKEPSIKKLMPKVRTGYSCYFARFSRLFSFFNRC